jgi:diguanylate cyclase (GGDEF)-like protein
LTLSRSSKREEFSTATREQSSTNVESAPGWSEGGRPGIAFREAIAVGGRPEICTLNRNHAHSALRRQWSIKWFMALVIGIVLIAMAVLLAYNWQFAISKARTHRTETQQSQLEQVRRAIERQLGNLTNHVHTVQAMLSAPDAMPDDDQALLQLLTTLVRNDSALATLSVVRKNGQYRSVFRAQGHPELLYATADPDGVMLSGSLELWKDHPEQLQRDTGFHVEQRPWYQQAVRNPGINWTPVYRYHSSGALAIGASLASSAKGEPLVIAADYLLAGLGGIIEAVSTRDSDGLVLLDPNLQIIAGNLGTLPDQGQRVRDTLKQDQPNFLRLLRDDVASSKRVHDLNFTFHALELPGNNRYWLLHVYSEQALIDRAVAEVERLIWLSFAIAALAILIISLLARQIISPLRQLTDLSTQFSKGHWSGEVPDSRILEVTQLSSSFKEMGAQIQSNLEELEQKVEVRTRQLQSLNDALQASNLTDPLTQIANRRYFHQKMDELFQSGQPVTLALLDVDHFKNFNDQYGHPAGDEALIQVARQLREIQLADTHVARVGGEEFAVLQTGSTASPLPDALETIRAAISGLRFGIPGGETLSGLSVSVGISMQRASDSNWTELYARADAALYRAKTRGRNQVVADGLEG